jgi:hypothetical protein
MGGMNARGKKRKGEMNLIQHRNLDDVRSLISFKQEKNAFPRVIFPNRNLCTARLKRLL